MIPATFKGKNCVFLVDIKVVGAETQLAQDCFVILYTELRQYNGCLCKKSIVVTAQFLRN